MDALEERSGAAAVDDPAAVDPAFVWLLMAGSTGMVLLDDDDGDEVDGADEPDASLTSFAAVAAKSLLLIPAAAHASIA